MTPLRAAWPEREIKAAQKEPECGFHSGSFYIEDGINQKTIYSALFKGGGLVDRDCLVIAGEDVIHEVFVR